MLKNDVSRLTELMPVIGPNWAVLQPIGGTDRVPLQYSFRKNSTFSGSTSQLSGKGDLSTVWIKCTGPEVCYFNGKDDLKIMLIKRTTRSLPVREMSLLLYKPTMQDFSNCCPKIILQACKRELLSFLLLYILDA